MPVHIAWRGAVRAALLHERPAADCGTAGSHSHTHTWRPATPCLQVEDIIDTGNTLKRVTEYLRDGGAASVKVRCAALHCCTGAQVQRCALAACTAAAAWVPGSMQLQQRSGFAAG